MKENKINVSVIIPACNEEKYLQQTLSALQQNENLEIILVDNGSTDRTVEIARRQGIKVVDFPVGTVAAVRNRGVQESSGDFLVFIDSDVRVAQDWHQRLPSVLSELKKTPMLVTGSRYQSPATKNLLNKYWYNELTQYEAPYINAGHLITTRELFEKINGFSENLETAEDYDFCNKARAVGAVVRNNADLVAIHDGYPQTWIGFIQRERWHGGQDFETWHSFKESKIAWFGALNLILLLVSLVFCLFDTCAALLIYLFTMYLISIFLTLYKFGIKRIAYMLVMPVIFYAYLCGRSLALLDKLYQRLGK